MKQKAIRDYIATISAIIFLGIVMLGISTLLSGCSGEEVAGPELEQSITDREALNQIADEDEALDSFEPNFNESELEAIMFKTTEQVYPVGVWRRCTLIEKDLNIVFEGDTAYGAMTRTYDCTFFISANFEETPDTANAVEADTLIEKSYTAVVKHNLVFVKVGDTRFQY